MRRGNIVAGGVVSLLVLFSFTIVLMSTGSVFAQIDGTAQQQTVMALVDQRFTQTAKAAAPTSTVNLDATANAMFFQLLTATANPAAVSSPAAPIAQPTSQTTSIYTALPNAPSRTPTPLPSASPTPLVAATQVASAESYLARGWELYWDSLPNYQSSQLAFSLAAYRDDEWAEPYVGIGLTQFQLFEYQAAVNGLTQAIELDDNDADLYLFRALAHYELLDYDNMIADATTAIGLNPYRTTGYNYRSVGFLYSGKFRLALNDVNQSLVLEPYDVVSFQRRAEIFDRLDEPDARLLDHYIAGAITSWEDDDTDGALAQLTQAIESPAYTFPDPITIAYAYYNRSRVHSYLGDYEAALDDLTSAIELFPDFAVAYVARGDLQIEHFSNRSAGMADIDQAIAVNPNYASAYLYRGFEYEGLGDNEASAPDYWNWIRLQQTRDIRWENRFTPGRPFSIGMSDGWAYYAPFNAQANQRVSVAAEAVVDSFAFGEPVDPAIVILDANGNPLVSSDDIGDSLDSLIQDFVLPAAGTYTLVISHAGGVSGGLVEVDIRLGGIMSTVEPATAQASPTLTATATMNTPTITSTSAPTIPLTPLPTLAVSNASDIVQLNETVHGFLIGIDWLPDGQTIVTSDSGSLFFYNASDFQDVETLRMAGSGGTMDISPDGLQLALEDGNDISIISVVDGRQLASLTGHRGSISDLEFSADGGWLASASEDATIRLWDMQSYSEAGVLRGHTDDILSIAISPDNHYLVSASLYDGSLKLWDISALGSADEPLEIGEPIEDFDDPLSSYLSVAFSPDGEFIAVGSGNTVELWRVTGTPMRGRPQRILEGHTDGVTVLAFSPDSALLASSSWDNTLILWDVSTGEQVASPPQEGADIIDIAFSPNNQLLAVAELNGRLSLWGLGAEDR